MISQEREKEAQWRNVRSGGILNTVELEKVVVALLVGQVAGVADEGSLGEKAGVRVTLVGTLDTRSSRLAHLPTIVNTKMMKNNE